MEKKCKAKRDISPEAIKSAAGVLLFFIGLLFAFSPFSHLKFIAYGIDWAFGYIGLYCLSLLLCFFGVCLIFNRRIRLNPSASIIGGLVLLFVPSFLLASYLGNGNGEYEFSKFVNAINADFSFSNPATFGALGLDPIISGGALGFLLVGLLNGVGPWLTILVISIVYVLAFVVLFAQLWEKLFRKRSSSRAISKSKKERKNLEEEPKEESKTESNPYEDKSETSETFNSNLEETFANRPVFVRAGSAKVVETRRSYQERLEEAQSAGVVSSPDPVKEDNPPSFNVFDAPKLEDGNSKSVAPAVFDFGGFSAKEQPAQPSFPSLQASQEIIAEPKPMRAEPSISAPTPTSAPSYEPKPEPIQTPDPFVSEAVSAKSTIIAPEQTYVEEEAEEEKEDDLGELDQDATPLPPYKMPDLNLINPPTAADKELKAKMEAECQEKIEAINQTFLDMGVGAQVVNHTIGPSVTLYEMKPNASVSVNSISRIIKDIEVRLGGVSGRFSERVAGTTNCALEVPNDTKRTVSFYEVFTKLKDNSPLQIPFGVDIHGNVVQGDLAEFPHMLVCGMTGSGKSVFIHGMIVSLIMRNRPEDLRLLLIDPKRVEFGKYRAIPHLLCPTVKEPMQAVIALRKLVEEMERRYALMERCDVRDILSYNNEYAPEHNKKKMPYIVCVIDEYADLVDTAKDVSSSLMHLAAKARSAGIHVIVATQRPDVKVISGTIKSNLPTRVALSVTSSVDSQTILGQGGAEDLLGHGDMLVDCTKISRHGFIRCQGCFLKDSEIKHVCDYVSSQQKQHFDPAFMDLNPHDDSEAEEVASRHSSPAQISASSNSSPRESTGAGPRGDNYPDALYQKVKQYVMCQDFCSISKIIDAFGLGYPRAQKIFKRLKAEGIVDGSSSSNNSKGSRVLVHAEADLNSNLSKDILNIDSNITGD